MRRRVRPRAAEWLRRAVTAPCVAVAVAATLSTPAAAQTGAIEGRVEIREQPQRRSADRYRTGRGGPEYIQSVPAVVYVVGAVPGAGPSTLGVEMVQRDTAFAPAAVVVGVGASVDFPNEDPFFHNVFSYSSTQRFDLGRYPQGESKAVTFGEAGIVAVQCEVHEQMRGAIVVTENPFHAVVAEDGSFRIEGVPAGEYTVAIWSADHDPEERVVTVPAGGAARIEVEFRQ